MVERKVGQVVTQEEIEAEVQRLLANGMNRLIVAEAALLNLGVITGDVVEDGTIDELWANRNKDQVKDN
tara:strand:+ start:107 stop:313 length:207 start_codon:yes stop_codon:yes gene_type:complete